MSHNRIGNFMNNWWQWTFGMSQKTIGRFNGIRLATIVCIEFLRKSVEIFKFSKAQAFIMKFFWHFSKHLIANQLLSQWTFDTMSSTGVYSKENIYTDIKLTLNLLTVLDVCLPVACLTFNIECQATGTTNRSQSADCSLVLAGIVAPNG